MINPVICEVTRGHRIESVHRGAFAVVDASGATVHAGGDVETPVFARSSLKWMQALPLVESGAADRFGLTDRHLAVATASHSGEPGHVACVRSMLAAAAVPESTLQCGPHWPRDIEVALALGAHGGRPGRIHNNCSGKHAGFLLAARALGFETASYLDPAHPLQVQIREAIADLSGAVLAGDVCSVDGCSAPTYALPLRTLATAMARLATGSGLTPSRAAAARRIVNAAMAEPWYVAGTGRTCTAVMELGAGRIYAKTGAEGVYVAALPQAGLGLALKCDDGAARAAERLLPALLTRHAGGPPELASALSALTSRPVRDFNGAVVGTLRARLDG
jgi:L-asparaginase II